MKFRKILILILTIAMVLSMSACGKQEDASLQEATVDVFVPDSFLVAATGAANEFHGMYPNITLRITHDESDTLAANVAAGYSCDVYIADASYLMDWLDKSSDSQANPNKNDCVLDGSRIDFAFLPQELTEEEIEEMEDYDPEANYGIIFTAAVVKKSANAQAALKFVEYLCSEACDEVYEQVGIERVANQE